MPGPELRNISFGKQFRVNPKLGNNRNWLYKSFVTKDFRRFRISRQSTDSVPERESFKVVERRRIFFSDVLPGKKYGRFACLYSRPHALISNQAPWFLVDMD